MVGKRLEKLLAEIDDLKSTAAHEGTPDRQQEDRFWKKIRLEWNYHSNHIEGNTLTYEGTELVLFFDRTPSEATSLRDVEQMKAHDVAIALVRQWAADKDFFLTEKHIRELNKILLSEPFYTDARTPDGQPTRKKVEPGKYKSTSNHVRLPNGEIFRFAEPEEVGPMMKELLEWYHGQGMTLHPLETAAILHYRLVRIHPFDDGNGRVARLVMNYHLMRSGYPPAIIKSEEKRRYLDALYEADSGKLGAFVAFIARASKWSLGLWLRAVRGERIGEPGDWRKELELLKRSLQGEKETTLRTPALLRARMRDSILPLIEELQAALREFDAFFLKSSEWLKLDESVTTLSDLEAQVREKPSLRNLAWAKSWESFRYKTVGPFALSVEILVTFEETVYSARLNGRVDVRLPAKLFTEPLTSTEVRRFVDDVASALMAQIRSRATIGQ